MQKRFLRNSHIAGSVRPDTSELCLIETERKRLDPKQSAPARSIWVEALTIDGSVNGSCVCSLRLTSAPLEALRLFPKCWDGPTAMRRAAMRTPARACGLPSINQRSLMKANGIGAACLVVCDNPKLGAVAGGIDGLHHAPWQLVIFESNETGPSVLSDLLEKPATAGVAPSALGNARMRRRGEPDRGALLGRDWIRANDVEARLGLD